jgi:hypothetical protein
MNLRRRAGGAGRASIPARCFWVPWSWRPCLPHARGTGSPSQTRTPTRLHFSFDLVLRRCAASGRRYRPRTATTSLGPSRFRSIICFRINRGCSRLHFLSPLSFSALPAAPTNSVPPGRGLSQRTYDSAHSSNRASVCLSVVSLAWVVCSRRIIRPRGQLVYGKGEKGGSLACMVWKCG